MKKTVILAVMTFFGAVQAQTDAFIGRGDGKVQIGANFQKWGTGIQASLDRGLGESFSFGVQAGYVMGFKEFDYLDKPKIGDRFDVKVRANAHLGDVIGLPQNFDIYPGLDLGLKNFGGHIGARLFFNKGLGIFAETQFPLARYNKDAADYDFLNNQFNVTIGASFDISKK
ncbi:hypothetical protein FUA25_08535 [Chryseobacterium sp.]|nr:hypothetical protein FUA25_08535 [Chryseobacterium sp.]